MKTIYKPKRFAQWLPVSWDISGQQKTPQYFWAVKVCTPSEVEHERRTLRAGVYIWCLAISWCLTTIPNKHLSWLIIWWYSTSVHVRSSSTFERMSVRFNQRKSASWRFKWNPKELFFSWVQRIKMPLLTLLSISLSAWMMMAMEGDNKSELRFYCFFRKWFYYMCVCVLSLINLIRIMLDAQL